MRRIVLQEANSFADENGLLFMETSAKNAMNVNEIFMAIGNEFIYFLIFLHLVIFIRCINMYKYLNFIIILYNVYLFIFL